MVTKTAENKYVSRVKDYKQVFSSATGKRVLYDLIKAHGVLSSSYDFKSESQTIFKEGERNVVLRILTLIKTDPSALMEHIERMEEENNL